MCVNRRVRTPRLRGGTGTYDGASGYIQEVGTFDFAANRGELDYYGKLIFGGA